jgi:adenylosuccinate synthase
LKYAVRINGISELAVTKLDILSGLENLRLCTAYHRDGKEFSDLPFGPADLSPYTPVYEDLPGWQEDISAARKWEELPPAAKNYLDRIAELGGVPVRLVSVGPERDQIVQRP